MRLWMGIASSFGFDIGRPASYFAYGTYGLSGGREVGQAYLASSSGCYGGTSAEACRWSLLLPSRCTLPG